MTPAQKQAQEWAERVAESILVEEKLSAITIVPIREAALPLFEALEAAEGLLNEQDAFLNEARQGRWNQKARFMRDAAETRLRAALAAVRKERT